MFINIPKILLHVAMQGSVAWESDVLGTHSNPQCSTGCGGTTGRTGDIEWQCSTRWHVSLLSGRVSSSDNATLVVVGAKPGRTDDIEWQCSAWWHERLVSGRVISSGNAALAVLRANSSRTGDLILGGAITLLFIPCFVADDVINDVMSIAVPP